MSQPLINTVRVHFCVYDIVYNQYLLCKRIGMKPIAINAIRVFSQFDSFNIVLHSEYE